MPNAIRVTLAGAIALILAAACSAPGVSPSPSPSQPPATATPAPTSTVAPTAATTEWVVFYARHLEDPLAVTVIGPAAAGDPVSELRTRLELLARANPRGPGVSFNVVPAAKARLAGVAIGGDLATLDYTVPGDDWGINPSTACFSRNRVMPAVSTAADPRRGKFASVVRGPPTLVASLLYPYLRAMLILIVLGLVMIVVGALMLLAPTRGPALA